MDTSIAEHSVRRYNTGLTQALTDGTNTYTYGLGRIAQTDGTTTDYFLPDALGSVRQLTDTSGAITYARAYDPYGVATAASGASQTPYGYTGEYTSNDLVYLRARHYDPGMGRFLTRDTWMGDYNRPLSLNRWNYVGGNPVNYVDPSGLMQCPWNLAINTCSIYDWYDWLYGNLYRAFGINTNVYIPTSSGNINLSGAVTSQYLQSVEPLANIYYSGSEIGLNAFPLGAYDFAQSFSGTNLLGQKLSPGERRLAAFWGMLGLGDCFPGLRFAPDGVGTGSVNKEVLLGLNARKGKPFKDTLVDFLIKGKRVLLASQWEDEALSTVDALDRDLFEQAFSEAMDNADRIHFDLTGFDKKKALREGIQFTQDNYTSFEYYSILNTPKWKAKTTFYEWINGVLTIVNP